MNNIEEQPVGNVLYKLLLLVNLDNELDRGGTLVIDTYIFNPGLFIGDEIRIDNWKVGVATETSLSNQTFSFIAKVMSIQKVAVRHEAFIIEIFLESPDKEIITQLRDVLRTRNPQQF